MRSDAELQSDVLNELKRDEWLRIEDLDVKAEGHVVTISGSAETHCQRWRALQLARYVAGIAPVSDRIRVQAAEARPRSPLTHEPRLYPRDNLTDGSDR